MSASLDRLYQNYRECADGSEDTLLAAIRNIAIENRLDEDFTQKLLVELWQILPTEQIDIRFTNWIRRRIRWYRGDYSRSHRDRQYPEIKLGDDDGETVPYTDVPGYFAFHREKVVDIYTHLSEIKDVRVKKVAFLLLEGYSINEASETLNMEPASVRQLLRRYRSKIN